MTSIISRLISEERIAARKLKYAFEEARSGKTISQSDRNILRAGTAYDLNAANPYARILLGTKLWLEFESFFEISELRQIPTDPLYWVTVADVECMTGLDQQNANLSSMIRKLRPGLKGLSYFGFVDLGLYANIAPGTQYDHRTGLNWHLHLFAWGETRKEMKRRAKLANNLPDNYRPIIPRPQGNGFHWSQVTAENIVWRFPYMCKTPRKAYRIGKRKSSESNGDSDLLFRSNRSDLRPGQRISLFHVLKRYDLDDLLIAGGDGVAIRRRAIRAALRQSY